jgi:hypothetical protein
MDNLLAAGGTKTITMEGMVFADVQLAVQGSRLAVRRFERKEKAQDSAKSRSWVLACIG